MSPGELPRIMRTHIMTGCLSGVWGTVVTGIVFTWYGNAVGMTKITWGILGAAGAWVVLVQPLGALLANRLGARKPIWWTFALLERLFRLLGYIASFFAWRAGLPGAWWMLLATILISLVAGNLSVAIWWGWLATIIPKEIQGAFWGRRDTWTSVAVIGALVPSMVLLDRIPADMKVPAVFGILVATSLLGFLDILWHGTIPEPPMPAERPRASLRQVLAPLRDRRFRPWLSFAASWNFSMSLGGSLCLLYFLQNLGLQDNMIGGAIAVNVVGLLGSILTARRLGRLVDRWGSRRVLLVGHLFWSVLPSLWLFATPATAVFWVGVASAVGGIFPTAANNAALKLVTRFPPPEESSMYMAASNSVANITGGLGALTAGIFLQVMGDWSFSVGRATVSAFPVLFVISAILRMVSTLVFVPRIREQGERDEGRPLLLPLFFGLPIKRRGP